MTRILIIDDEPINHQLVAHALVSLKCELHFSDNGNDGVWKRVYKRYQERRK